MAYIDLIFTNWSFVMMIVEINICNYIPEAYIAFGIVPVEMNQCNYKQEAYIDQRFIIWPLVMYW
jgi:hypothetical protein